MGPAISARDSKRAAMMRPDNTFTRGDAGMQKYDQNSLGQATSASGIQGLSGLYELYGLTQGKWLDSSSNAKGNRAPRMPEPDEPAQFPDLRSRLYVHEEVLSIRPLQKMKSGTSNGKRSTLTSNSGPIGIERLQGKEPSESEDLRPNSDVHQHRLDRIRNYRGNNALWQRSKTKWRRTGTRDSRFGHKTERPMLVHENQALASSSRRCSVATFCLPGNLVLSMYIQAGSTRTLGLPERQLDCEWECSGNERLGSAYLPGTNWRDPSMEPFLELALLQLWYTNSGWPGCKSGYCTQATGRYTLVGKRRTRTEGETRSRNENGAKPERTL